MGAQEITQYAAPIPHMSDWINRNPGAFITIIVLIVGNIWSLAVAMEQARRTAKAVEEMREDIDMHLKEPGIHRTPDSEARITRIDAGISAIGNILTDVKEQLAALGAGRRRN